MSTHPCPRCGEQSKDGHLCHKCTRATKDALGRIAELWPVLTETLTRQDRLSAPSEIRAEMVYGPVPFKPQASITASAVRARLVTWAKVCIEDYGATCPRDTIGALCALLRDHAGQLRKHAESEAWADDVMSSRDEIAGAVDLPTERARITTGPCPEKTDDGEPCPGIVVAIYPTELGPHADCTPAPTAEPGTQVCGRSWPSATWAHLGSRILARQAQIEAQKARGKQPGPTIYDAPAEWVGGKGLIDVSDAAVTYGIPRGTLERWIRDGRIRKYRALGLPKGRGRPALTLVDPRQIEDKAPDMRLDKTGDKSC